MKEFHVGEDLYYDYETTYLAEGLVYIHRRSRVDLFNLGDVELHLCLIFSEVLRVALSGFFN